MKATAFQFLFIFTLSFCLSAQTVSTLVGSFPGNDGVSIGPDGNIYVNVWGNNGVYNGNQVYKVTPQGEFSLFANGLSVFPSGSIFDLNGNLLITGWASGTISRLRPDGTSIVISGGISGAGGLEVDQANNIFISEYYNHRILKLDSLGNNPVTFASNDPINGPSGLTYIEADSLLFVGNWDDGRISVVSPDGIAAHFATLPTPNVGTLMHYDGYIYTTSPLFNKIYKINIATSEVELFAGTGVLGNKDGPVNEATFNFPIGISTIDGNTFYVSESFIGGGRLRLIETESVHTKEQTYEAQLLDLFPNPCSDNLQINSKSINLKKCTLQLYNSMGQSIRILPIVGSENEIRFNTKNLAPGIYSLRFINNAGALIKMHPFIKLDI